MKIQEEKYKDKSFKIIDLNSNSKILFDIETNSIFEISKNLSKNLLLNNLTDDEQSEFNYLIANNFFHKSNKITLQKHNATDGENLSINVNLTSSCNLVCKYCFAQGGDYGDDKGIMKSNILSNLEHFIYNNVTSTKTVRIEFFGGEPLLNPEMIENIFKCCEKIKNESQIEFIYRISTNLTILPENIFNIFLKGNFIVSVSIDGGEQTQNFNRPGKSGNGYYNSIIQNCIRLRSSSDKIILVARMTVFSEIKSLISNVKELQQLNIFDYFQIYPAFIPENINEGIISDKNLWKNNNIKYLIPDKIFTEYIDFISQYRFLFSSQNRFKGNLEFERIADLILNRKIVNSFCSGGRNYFTISADKSIVPCHRFIGNDKFKVGYLDGEFIKPIEWQTNYLNIPQCSECWGRYLCGGGCKQQNFIRIGSINEPDSFYCKNDLLIIESVIRNIAIQNNEYKNIDRKILDKLFVSCGRPILKSNYIPNSLDKLKHFKLLNT